MRIVDAQSHRLQPGRNFVTLKLVTEDGVYGLGDATLNGRELAVASYLSDHVIPLLIGRDARRIEDIWQYLYKGAYWRRGPVTMTAIAAVDTALWDILRQDAQHAGVSAARRRVARLGDGLRPRQRLDATTRRCRRCSTTSAMGYRAVRAQCAIPGVVHAYGVGRGTLYYEPAQKGMPLESVWSTERYLDFVPPLFERLRREVGFDVHLLHDVHHRLTPIEAARLGKSLEPYRLFWLEDPVPAENQAAFRTIRQHTTTPIAVGEVFNTIYDCAQLIEEELIDYIRMTVVHGGGISHLRKIAALAELHHVRTGSHGATDLSPVAMAAALHFDLSVHNFGIQEYMRHTPTRPTLCFRTPTRSSAARCIRATRPGSASTSTRRSPRRIRTSRRICRSTANWMGRCTHGDTAANFFWLRPASGFLRRAGPAQQRPAVAGP